MILAFPHIVDFEFFLQSLFRTAAKQLHCVGFTVLLYPSDVLPVIIQRFPLQAGKPFLTETEGQVRCRRHNQPCNFCPLILGHAKLFFLAVARGLGLRKPDLKITDALQVLPHSIRCAFAVLGQDFCFVPLLKLVHFIKGPL